MAQFKLNMALILMSFITVVLLFTLVSSHNPYQYLLFTQQWPKSVCHPPKSCSKPPPSVFTVHGLWPSNYSGSGPCNGSAFSPALMNRDAVLKANLAQHSWPDVISGNHMGFWQHEWNAHGQCSENVFPQTQYFQWCHNMWKNQVIHEMLQRFSITPQATKLYSLSEIESAIKTNTSHIPYIRCQKFLQSYLLKEVVICFDYYGNNIVHCSQATDNCPTTGSHILYPN